ncbi:lipopolysaccharide biosynthesis protein [Sphingobium vermicomposti]|uniref:O-antigen/teichoic acid export membrane protein n=1 Tax=Sphingobium vermicomposti TaxID=529005 RepID=A0A846M1T2_9SPHN|nr:lipopolysaccharide biosynthesis protein [Sphingobium vermicomposti]NIJ15892.1 O-antigen/teichoic acid export membrane protein [Sphingobium vermicomposti]
MTYPTNQGVPRALRMLHDRFGAFLVKGTRARLVAVGHLLSGNFLNALIMLVSVAMAARSLGPATYGVMVLVLSYNRVVERILRFESWQPLIRFAVQDENRASPRRMQRLYCYGLMLDMGAAALAAVTAIALALLLGPLFGLKPLHIQLVAIYSIATLFNVAGVPVAALRLSGQFKMLAYAQVAGNVLRIFFALFCMISGAGVLGFMVAWTAAQVLGSLIVFWTGFRALRAMGIANPLHAKLKGLTTDFPGFFGFACSTNLSLTLRVITTEADSLFVGALAGTSAAAVYYLAKRIAKVAMQVGAQVQAVIYPDVSRMWAKGNLRGFRATTLQVQAALALVGILMLGGGWLIGPLLIRLGPGEAYSDAYVLLLTQLFAVMLLLHAAPSRSAMLAMNQSWHVLAISGLGTAIFVVVASYAVPRYGALGGNIAHVVLGIVEAVLMDIFWLRKSRRPPVAANAG